MNNFKIFQRLAIPLLSLTLISCTTVKYYPANFVESLKHPTKFPDVFSSTVQNIEDVAAKNPLGENEEIKITNVGENKNSSMHLVQIRENGELRPHYHKQHDEVIYVKKGSGIATLDGARYIVKPGSILQIPGKTVHKFLNTGGEQFIAVSIFSPPFDGRDEKKIKERRKTDRSTKEEKRLASKKPEKVTQKEDSPSGKRPTEPAGEEVKTDTEVTESKNVAEKDLNKPAKKILDTDTENIPFTSKKLSTSEGKKKIKETKSTEEPPINIEELHEKLSKLLELKEEGTISSKEYEEKKDALIKGKDIGGLPEPKGIAKKKTPIIEEESSVEQAEEHAAIDTRERVTDEYEDNVVSQPPLSSENELGTQEVESTEEKELPTNDKLEMLEEMKQEGLISEEAYERKKEAIIGTTEEKDILTPSENINKDNIESPVNEAESVEKKESRVEDKLKTLEEMKQEGLITEEDYESKKKAIVGSSEENTTSILPESITKDEDEKVEDLKELFDQGLITKDDYELKLKEITDAQTHNISPDTSAEKGIENDKLSELNELRKEGLISEEDYELKKSQLLGK
ncbi:MAG: SHOCT domain-containing protein [Planctomycetota bacterium]